MANEQQVSECSTMVFNTSDGDRGGGTKDMARLPPVNSSSDPVSGNVE